MELPQIQPFTMVVSAICSIYMIILLTTIDMTRLYSIISLETPAPTTLAPTTLSPTTLAPTTLAPTKAPKIVNMRVGLRNKLQLAKRNLNKKAEPV